jgi:chlorite dismutase
MNPQREPHRRQYVSFTFYEVLPEWRRLPLSEREEHRREFAEAIHKWQTGDTMKVLTYSLVGLRPECHFMLWRICYSLECLQEMVADLLRTRLGGYIHMSNAYLGMTRRSQYDIGDAHALHGHVLRPGAGKYLFLYPLVRSRSWYLLPFEERQRMVREIISVGEEFHHARLNVLYSFGLDDQDFIMAIETDHPDEYLERVMRLREVEASPYTLRDTPMYTCLNVPLADMLERIG